ncbi:MAG: choice-of-anchor B family protein [Flavobacteriales bacterium]
MSTNSPLRSTVSGLLAMLFPFMALAQLNITELGRLDYQALRNSDLSNLWGYTDEFGNEYAVVGVNGTGPNNPGGVSVVDVSDPADPVEVFFFPGPTSIWREVKVYNDHAYITTEAENGGLTIVDLSPLPQSTDLPATVWLAPDWTTSHTLFIDENGRLYIFGSARGNGGVIMYDIMQDPMAPVEIGSYDEWYVHDGYARGDTLYAGHIYDGFFSIIDVSDPAAPVLLGTQDTPNNFTHNVWLDDSGEHLFTTDERTNAFVGSYDVSDPTDILFEDKLQSDPGSGTIPHNTYWLDHYLVTSYYTYGVVIYDVTHPDNMVEVGHYDTSPDHQGDGFNGDWGVYPFFPSGNLIVSDIERGLVILAPDYQRACWLEGTVSDQVSTAPVNQATVTIVGLTASDITGFDGQYGTGYSQAGTYDVAVNAPGYVPALVSGVELVQGQVTVLDVQLEPLVSFALQGVVIDAVSGDPIPDAQVELSSVDYAYGTVSGPDGTFELPAVFADSYAVLAGKWGWRTACPAPQSITQASGPLTIALERGIADDFALDLGWIVSGGAATGGWVREVPVGTVLQGQPSNPGSDVAGDCGEKAYVTGNGGGDAGTDDVDDGSVVLLSPEFDATGMVDAHVRFYRWFFNAGGSGNPNDQMIIELEDGTSSVVVATINANSPGTGAWLLASIDISDHMAPTAAMRLRVTVNDNAPGHIVEGAIDRFELIEMSTTSVQDIAEQLFYSIRPNPSNGAFEVVGGPVGGTITLHDATGRVVWGPVRTMGGTTAVDATDIGAGTYLLSVSDVHGARTTERIMIQP